MTFRPFCRPVSWPSDMVFCKPIYPNALQPEYRSEAGRPIRTVQSIGELKPPEWPNFK
jgi:hypothetical protein